jgi:hypothetical protein
MLVTTVAMRIGSGWQFALNALTFVPELVNKVGRPARPWVVQVGDFSVVEVSHRASLVRVETWSRCPVERASYESEYGRGVLSSEPRTSRNMVEAFRSLSQLVPLVLFYLIVDCGCPLFLVRDIIIH